MEESAVPASVQALLRERVESYEELEILLLLARERDREWIGWEIEERLGIPLASFSPALAKLCASELVRCEGVGLEQRVRFAPRSVGLASAVDGLLRAYQTHRLEIVRIMNASAIERMRTGALRAFADAFVLGKDKKDG